MSRLITKEALMRANKLNEESEENDNNLKSVKEPKLYKLSDKVIKALNDRIKDEYTAHYYYRAATNWCNDRNYKKAAEFFKNEANDELEHATLIQEYMAGFNILPNIQKTETNHEFDNLVDVVYGAYEMELGLMESYNDDSHSIFLNDLTTFDFLQQFREIQRGAVVEYNDLINAIELIDKTDKFQVLYFEQTYF